MVIVEMKGQATVGLGVVVEERAVAEDSAVVVEDIEESLMACTAVGLVAVGLVEGALEEEEPAEVVMEVVALEVAEKEAAEKDVVGMVAQ